MRWAILRKSLVRSVRTLHFKHLFEHARTQYAPLERFGDLDAVVEFLSRRGDLDEKDRLFAALVTMVQRGHAQPLATSLLWLGCWPALQRIYARRQKYFHSHAEFVSAIGDAFSELVATLNVTRVSKVAATLARSTDRDVMAQCRLAWKENDRTEPYDEEYSAFAAEEAFDVDRVAILLHELARAVRADVDVVMDVMVAGVHRAAEARGVSHEVARKRFHRALGRLRGRFQRIVVPN